MCVQEGAAFERSGSLSQAGGKQDKAKIRDRFYRKRDRDRERQRIRDRDRIRASWPCLNRGGPFRGKLFIKSD